MSVYNGEVKIFQDDLDRFLAIAQRYKIQGLISQEGENQPQQDGVLNKTEELLAEKPVLNKRNGHYPTEMENKEGIKRNELRIRTPTKSFEKQVVPISSNVNDVEEQINQYMEKLGPENYACKMCGKTATKTTNIRNHIETHLEGISYPCPICFKSFRSKNSFNNHKSVYHGN